MDFGQLFSSQLVKIAIFAIMIYLGYMLANNKFDGAIKEMKKMRRRYGIITLLVFIVWWLLTPSFFSPDDIIIYWLVDLIGFYPYLILILAVTIYLIHRLRVTIVIVRKRGR